MRPCAPAALKLPLQPAGPAQLRSPAIVPAAGVSLHPHACNLLLSGPCAADTVVIGGTVQKGDSDTAPRDEERAGILDRACRVLPSLEAAEVVREWVSQGVG